MMIKRIAKELEHHAPFTFFGAFTGIVMMLIFKNIPANVSYKVFYTLHPAHVVLSALVTASMYKLHTKKSVGRWILIVTVGYVGSIGIATLSDSIIPYLGECLLKLPHREVHLGFIEEWWIINPAAFLGIAIAVFRPTTKFPHAGHVLLSTWASLFHIYMAIGLSLTVFSYVAIFFFLFLSVWIPCCISDIVFPLMFVNRKNASDKARCVH